MRIATASFAVTTNLAPFTAASPFVVIVIRPIITGPFLADQGEASSPPFARHPSPSFAARHPLVRRVYPLGFPQIRLSYLNG